MPLYPSQVSQRGTHDCRLDYVSTSQIKLNCFGGNRILINGQQCVIPSAGIVSAIPATSPNNNHYVYVTPSMTLGFGAVGLPNAPTLDAYGMPIVDGNPNAVLVGMIHAQNGAIDGPRLVCSYWNRKWRFEIAQAVVSTTSYNAFADLGLYVFWVGFLGDTYEVVLSGSVASNTAGTTNGTQVQVNGEALQNQHLFMGVQDTYYPIGVRGTVRNLATAGLQSAALFGAVFNPGGNNSVWYPNLCVRHQA
jgi:hypothetical protein